MSVPVLSEQMHEVAPRVSIDSKSFTTTYFSDNFLAVIDRAIVTKHTIPSGTFAHKIPMPIMFLYK